MNPHTTNPRPLLLVIIAVCTLTFPLLMTVDQTNAQSPTHLDRLLIPIGGGYSDIYAGFLDMVAARSIDNNVKILVLPVAYASNPKIITKEERKDNLVAAEERRLQLEEACKNTVTNNVTCNATLAPILVRSDAENPDNLHFFTSDLSAIFILGGDQTIAMQVIANTPVEDALVTAYEGGTIIAGTSAGGGMQSATMLAGYNTNFTDSNSLNFGAVDVWNTPEKHGLPFGIQNAILDQHFFQRSRLGRLLNAISLPGVPHIGIGIDAYTGVLAADGENIEKVFGLYTVTILDAETYHSAEAVQYHGISNTLGLRNVLVHQLSPGDASYNLKTRQPSLAPVPEKIERDYSSLTLPQGAGVLMLGGKLSENLDQDTILTRFINFSGGKKANLLIIAAGYSNDASAQRAVEKYQKALSYVPTQIIIIPKDAPHAPPAELSSFTGVIFIGEDQSIIPVQALPAIKEAWLDGMPVLADDAAAAVIGTFYSAHSPTPDDEELAEAATQESFVQGQTTIRSGLGLLNIQVEPQVMEDNRWGRIFSLAYYQPALLTLGITNDTAIEITPNGATILGNNVLFILDFSHASLALGDNHGFVIANGLLDVFAPQERVLPVLIDTDYQPVHASTPALAINTLTTPTATMTSQSVTPAPPQITPSLTATRTPRISLTRVARPTGTAPVIPPSPDQNLSMLMMLFALLAVVVAGFGIWINRKRAE